jgi:2-polyprenyl-3-methyl-5-hydroxy-6-metoxy-1,4-benzoquinol methylase
VGLGEVKVSLNYQFFAEQIGRFGGPHAKVLDFGCGRGQIVQAARTAGYDAYGCNRYPATWEWMSEDLGAKEFIRKIGDDERIPFEDETFDVVTANQVLEHIPKFEKPLAEIRLGIVGTANDGEFVLSSIGPSIFSAAAS